MRSKARLWALLAYAITTLVLSSCEIEPPVALPHNNRNRQISTTDGYMFKPAELTIQRGGSATDSVLYEPEIGKNKPQNIILSYPGNRPGIRVQPILQTFFPGTAITISIDSLAITGSTDTIYFDASTPDVDTTTGQLTGTTSKLSNKNSLIIHVTQGSSPDFAFSLTRDQLAVLSGDSDTLTINIQRFGAIGSVTFSLDPAPSQPFTISANPNPVSGAATIVNVLAGTGVSHGDFYFGAIRGSSGGIIRTMRFQVSIPAPWPDQSSGVIANLNGITQYNLNDAVAVGDNGTVVSGVYDNNYNVWNWTTQSVGTVRLNAIALNSKGKGVAVGDSGAIFWTTTGGAGWNRQTSPTSNRLLGASKSSINDLEAVVVGEHGTILYTTDGGTSWNVRASGTAADLYAASSSGSFFRLFAVGDSGIILRSDNQGQTWTSLPSGTNLTLRGVYAFGSTVVTAVGDQGTILRTTDGTNWTRQQSRVTSDLHAVGFMTANTGYAVGANGTILATDNGGGIWTKRIGSVNADLNCLAMLAGWITAAGNGGTILGNR